MRRYVNGAEETGFSFEPGDISSISEDRQTEDVEIKAKDKVVKSESNFNKYRLTMELQSVRPQYYNYFKGGTFEIDGDRAKFKEDTTKTPDEFVLYVPSSFTGDSGSGDKGQWMERYGKCTTQNFNKSRTTGEATPFTAVIDSLEGSETVWVKDGDLTTSDFTNSDATAPTVASTEKVVLGVDTAIADAATGVEVTAAFKATFSEDMDQASLTRIKLTLDSSGDAVAVTRSYDQTTFEYTLTPVASLTASTAYTWTIPTSVRDVAQNSLASATSIGFTTA